MSCSVSGQKYPGIERLPMSLTTTVMPTGCVSNTGMTLLSHPSHPPPNRKPCAPRTRRVTMGAVSRPARRPEEESDDADLLRRISAGDRNAVDDLYVRFRRPAFALARRILADDVLAEDVLQDVFVSVWRDPGAFDRSRGSFASWLLAMVHHKAVDAVRREESHRRRQARAEADLALTVPIVAEDVEDAAWTRVVSARVRVALAVLPTAQREALTLAYYGGYTQREVAALTGAPLGTVKTRMLAGMRRLREELGGPVGGASLGGALGGAAPAGGTSR